MERTLREHILNGYNVFILGIVYLLFGLISSYFINKYSRDVSKDKNSLTIIFEASIEVGFTVLVAYIIHQIVENLPLPLFGSEQEKKDLIREIRGGIVIAFAMFALQVKLRNKIQLLFFGDIQRGSYVDY